MPDIANLAIRVDSSQIRRADRQLDKYTNSARRAQLATRAFGRSAVHVGRQLTAFVTLPIAAAFAGAAAAAIRFEQAMVEVQKVAGEAAAAQLAGRIKNMANVIPIARNQLVGLTADVVRFGITGVENIVHFTRVVAKMAVATDLTAEQAGESLAKLISILGLSTDEVDNLASAINSLDNAAATSSQEIVQNMLRATKGLNRLGLTTPQIITLAGTLNEVTAQASRAGTRLARLGSQLATISVVENLVVPLGLTIERFRQLREATPYKLLLRVIAVFKEGGMQARRLADALGTTATKAVAGLAQNLDSLIPNLEIANEEFQKGTSINKEFEDALSTTWNQMKQLWNQLLNTAGSIGKAFLPAIKNAVNSLSDFLVSIQDLSRETKIWIGILGGITATVPFVIIALGALSASISSVMGLMVTMSGTVLPALISAFSTFQIAAYTAATEGIAAMIAGLGALGTALVATGIGAFIVALGLFAANAYDAYQDLRRLRKEVEILMDIPVQGSSLSQLKDGLDAVQNKIKELKTSLDDSLLWDFLTMDWEVEETKMLQQLQRKANSLKSGINEIVGDTFVPNSPMQPVRLPGITRLLTLPKFRKPLIFKPPVQVDPQIQTKGGGGQGGNTMIEVVKQIYGNLQNALNTVSFKVSLPAIFTDTEPIVRRINIIKNAVIELYQEGQRGTDKFQELIGTLRKLRTVQDTLEAVTDIQVFSAAGDNSLKNMQEDLRLVGQTAGKVQNDMKHLDEATRQLNFTFQSAFEDAIIAGKRLSDVLVSLLKDIERIILRAAVIEPLTNALGGLFSDIGIGSLLGSTSVGDALITDDGKIIQGHPNDNWLAFQGDPGRLGGSTNVEVNVINKSDSQVKTRERKTAGGTKIDMIIENTVRQKFHNGNFDNDMAAVYGINRRGR